ncbi:hypothetical protein KKF84_15625 [Myxococcota bacterium]|nr:hypothetical protein [Myxococcota bacterium]
MKNLLVRSIATQTIFEFLADRGFFVEQVTDKVIRVSRDGEIPVFLTMNGNSLIFQVDLGNIKEIGSKELYFRMLDLNTEILPISLALDTSHADDIRLVLVESREVKNLDDNQLLGVFYAFEIATERVELALAEFVN